MGVRAGRQEHTVLKEHASIHRVAGVYVLRDRELHEAIRGDDLDPARPDVRFVHDATDPGPVVAMCVGIHDSHDGALAEMLIDESKGSP